MVECARNKLGTWNLDHRDLETREYAVVICGMQ